MKPTLTFFDIYSEGSLKRMHWKEDVMPDEEIIELYLKKDEKAIAATKEKYYNYLYKIAYQILGNHEDAEECLDDTFLSVWDFETFKRESSLMALLIKITRRTCIDVLRKRNSQKRIPSECMISIDELADSISGGYSPDKVYDSKMLNRAIGKFVSTLPRDQRNLFIGRYYYYDPLKDIAEYNGITESKAKSMLFRIRKKLRKYLAKEGFDL